MLVDKVFSASNGYRLLFFTLTALVALAFLLPSSTTQPVIRVAFVGNSITFVNDLPRFVQALGGNHYIEQDSCLHGGLSFLSMTYKGNGMYLKWKTKKALLQGDKDNDPIYDFGACSVPQLLLGHDEEFYYENSGKFSDGKNPCTANPSYLEYRESLYNSNASLEQQQQQQPMTWDFVVLNDQSRYPLTYEKRGKSLMALYEIYAPLFNTVQATAVLLVTYAYVAQSPQYADDDNAGWKKFTPTDTEDDMPYMTSLLYYGYQEYEQVLAKSGVPVRLAQVGLAFLTVWEEDRELWRRLFFYDGLHPSPLGTYLEGCVVYSTIRQQLPPMSLRIEKVSRLWDRARRMHLGSYKKYIPEEEYSTLIPMALPTRDEARFLSNVCRRVALKGYLPPSLWSIDQLDETFYSNYPDADDASFAEYFIEDYYGDDYYVDDDDAAFWWN